MMNSTQYNNNGHNGADGIPIDLNNFLRPSSTGNAATMFIESGRDILDLLMRTHVIDFNEATDIGEIISYCKKYNLTRPLAKIYYILAVRVSINQSARRQMLQAQTGILSPQIEGFKGKGISSRANKDDYDYRKRGNY